MSLLAKDIHQLFSIMNETNFATGLTSFLWRCFNSFVYMSLKDFFARFNVQKQRYMLLLNVIQRQLMSDINNSCNVDVINEKMKMYLSEMLL